MAPIDLKGKYKFASPHTFFASIGIKRKYFLHITQKVKPTTKTDKLESNPSLGLDLYYYLLLKIDKELEYFQALCQEYIIWNYVLFDRYEIKFVNMVVSFQAKIACTSICKCVGCRNVEETLERARRRAQQPTSGTTTTPSNPNSLYRPPPLMQLKSVLCT